MGEITIGENIEIHQRLPLHMLMKNLIPDKWTIRIGAKIRNIKRFAGGNDSTTSIFKKASDLVAEWKAKGIDTNEVDWSHAHGEVIAYRQSDGKKSLIKLSWTENPKVGVIDRQIKEIIREVK